LTGGSSPSPDSLKKLKRNDSSSETKGSSMESVVGKNRLPATPCAHALGGIGNRTKMQRRAVQHVINMASFFIVLLLLENFY
jgi:hypothetical protein